MERHGFFAVKGIVLEDIRRLNELGAQAYAADIREALAKLEREALASAYSQAGYYRNAKSLEAAKRGATNSATLPESCSA